VYARRVIERVASRSCARAGGEIATRSLVAWIDRGHIHGVIVDAGGAYPWSAPAEAAWSEGSLSRLTAWAQSGATCAVQARVSGAARDASTPTRDASAAPGRSLEADR